jgi:predicted GIY-YIG superfamily endonuclease
MTDGPHVLYRLFNSDGELLYIGITKDLPARLCHHRTRKPWFSEVTRSSTENFANRGELAAAEIRAIQNERPKYNSAYLPASCLFEGVRPIGRPEIGTAVNFRLGELLTEVDRYAAGLAISRAEAIRQLVRMGLKSAASAYLDDPA